MTNITTPDSARAALDREAEIGKLADRIRLSDWHLYNWGRHAVDYAAGCRAGLTAYRPAYELAVYIAPLLDDYDYDDIGDLVDRAKAALEAAR